ncbi:hypothetical protein IM774_03655 [Erysipelotrichaceae bacterium RD49]|nr:hypothetical protein [Erysipelotrichaceae bacterium RD49]
MTINLDVLMYLARIALCVAGVIAIIYLVLLFKSVIETMGELQETLKAVNRDLVKLESPLDTVGQVSNTVNEVQASAKRAAMGAIDVFSKGTEMLGGKLKKQTGQPAGSPASQSEARDADAIKADFQKITEDLGSIAKDEEIIAKNDGSDAH